MTIQDLILYFALIAVAIAIYQHLNISLSANQHVADYCEQHELILLDQSVILKQMRMRRSSRSLFALQRLYTFEFSTTADTRYSGNIVFIGSRFKNIDVPPHRIM